MPERRPENGCSKNGPPQAPSSPLRREPQKFNAGAKKKGGARTPCAHAEKKLTEANEATKTIGSARRANHERRTASVSRVADIKGSVAGKTRLRYTNFRWGGTGATSAPRSVGRPGSIDLSNQYLLSSVARALPFAPLVRRSNAGQTFPENGMLAQL